MDRVVAILQSRKPRKAFRPLIFALYSHCLIGTVSGREGYVGMRNVDNTNVCVLYSKEKEKDERL